MEEKQKVVIDTNIWIYAVKNKIDLFKEFLGFDIFITRSIKRELENFCKEKKKECVYAKIALQMIEKMDVEILPESGYVDKDLIKLGEKGYYIVTEDSVLIKQLKRKNIRGFILRQGKYFESIENIGTK